MNLKYYSNISLENVFKTSVKIHEKLKNKMPN